MKKYIPLLFIAPLLLSACNLSGNTDEEYFSLQEKCSDKSIAFLGEELGNKTNFKITNFYNTELGTCFALYKNLELGWENFYDVLTRKQYGRYDEHISNEGAKSNCKFTNPKTGIEVTCNDYVEFSKLTKSFMEN